MTSYFDDEFHQRLDSAARENDQRKREADERQRAGEAREAGRAELARQKAGFISSLPPPLNDPEGYARQRAARLERIAAGVARSLPPLSCKTLVKREGFWKDKAVMRGWVLATYKRRGKKNVPDYAMERTIAGWKTIDITICTTVILASDGKLYTHEYNDYDGLVTYPLRSANAFKPLVPVPALPTGAGNMAGLTSQQRGWLAQYIKEHFAEQGASTPSAENVENLLARLAANRGYMPPGPS
jgi:hypothetical protein